MTAPRLPDWQLRLEAFAREQASMPFTWGVNDCGLFAANCVRALTGADPAPWMRGAYATSMGAARVIAQGGGLHAIACEACGAPIPVLRAAVGDVVLIEQPMAGPTLAICNGATAMGPGPDGLVQLPMALATSAWKVG